MSNTNILAVQQDEIKKLKIHIAALEHELRGMKEILNQKTNELIKEKLKHVNPANPRL